MPSVRQPWASGCRETRSSASRPHRLERLNEPILFLSHHKCATKWLTSYLKELARSSGLTFATTHMSQELPAGDVTFLCNAEYEYLARVATGGIHVLRNPLSVIVSAYFSHLRTHSLEGWPELEIQRALLSTETKSAGLFLTTAFLERIDFCPGAVGPLHALRCWDYADGSFVTIRMEDLVESPATVVRQSLRQIGVDTAVALPSDADYAFQAFSGGRRVGESDETSHYRSGCPDDWQNHLPTSVVRYVTSHMREVFERYYPEVLKLLG